MTYIGIDPGKNGALALIDGDKTHTFRFDKDAYRSVLSDIGVAVCCLESVGSMPGNGRVSMFYFGENFGWIQGTLEAFGVPYELVTPQKWKKEFSVTADKNTSIAVCKRLFPGVSLIPPGCRKEHDGMAEALLMAEYARRRIRPGDISPGQDRPAENRDIRAFAREHGCSMCAEKEDCTRDFCKYERDIMP